MREEMCCEWIRQTRNQTDKQWAEGQANCARNVTDSRYCTVTLAHMLLGRLQVSQPPPLFTHGCEGSLKEARLVLVGKSYNRRRGSESASVGCLVRAGLLYTLVLIWGQLHKAGAKRGPHGYKTQGLNLNITSIKTWPTYNVCETEFSTSPHTWIDT